MFLPRSVIIAIIALITSDIILSQSYFSIAFKSSTASRIMENQIPFISGFSNYWNKLHSTPQSGCVSQNNKLLSLLNLLCNTTQTTSIQERDACYGCFFRAGNLPGGSTQLSSLSQCANLYISGSIYAECARGLALIANGTQPTTAPTTSGCYTGYCDFVRCVRRINANRLINDCVAENLLNRDLTMMVQRIYFYTNATSCILARTRCNAYNPISGELQNQATYNYGHGFGGFGTTLVTATSFNSLQIGSTGDIRIVSFPAVINVAELFCSRVPTLEQSNYGNIAC